MKFISLFNKTPNHKRFSFQPRYYDAAEEERREREERIKREIARERGEATEDVPGYRARIKGSFHSSRKRSKSEGSTKSAALLRLGVLLFVTLFVMAFITWGKPALYSLVLIVPLYLYAKLKR
ncbi:MAG: hypothetical protein JST14_17825 [Bacteroidetes bacterium]|nr:hypothetical protein [Bacteroidota bacterium]